MAESVDGFTSLPIELLLTILSQLPFKEVVRNCVLSKKWSKICKSTTNMEFNELFFVKLDESDETKEAQRRAFLEFINIWIGNHQGSVVDKFSLRLSMPENVGDIIDRCVSFATLRGVKELALDFADADRSEDMVYFDDYEAQLMLPAQVYEHSSLESLKLYSCGFVVAQMVNFHLLKQVSLGWMKVSLAVIKALLSNCEMLESLSFNKCWNSENFDLGDEPNNTLRKLDIDKCRYDYGVFRINAPNLKIFKYCGLMHAFNVEIHCLELEEAHLDFSPEYGFEGYGHPLCNLVEALYTARLLTVCSFVLQVIPSGPEQIRDMHVRHLIMKAALHQNEFMGITFFLNCCPMLEHLTIEISSLNDLFDYEAPFDFNLMRFWIDHVGVYKCLRSSLKVVEINGFTGTMNQHHVLRYLIFSGVVLKKISINMLKDGSGNVESHCRKSAEILLTVPRVQLRNENLVEARIAGTVNISSFIILKDVLYAPMFSFNLVSISKLVSSLCCSLHFSSEICIIEDQRTKMIGSAKLMRGSYYLNSLKNEFNKEQVSFTVNNNVYGSMTVPESSLWHFKLGHASNSQLEKLCKQLSYVHINKNGVCDIYYFAKQRKTPFPLSSSKTLHAFELLDMDIWGPFPISSVHGYIKYFLTIVDDFSRFTWVVMLKGKYEAHFQIQKFVLLVENKYNVAVKKIRNDNGPEFIIDSFYATKGVFHQTSCVETPRQNGKAERKHQHVLNILNDKSSFELLHGRLPDLGVFGCLCFVSTQCSCRTKFDPRTRKRAFLVFKADVKGYVTCDLHTQEILVSRNVIFHDLMFPFKYAYTGIELIEFHDSEYHYLSGQL
ncbi:putative F-box/LRR-repeat protein, partial [Mucuna pruriens]